MNSPKANQFYLLILSQFVWLRVRSSIKQSWNVYNLSSWVNNTMYLFVEEFLAYQRGQLNCRIETLVSSMISYFEICTNEKRKMFQIFHLCYAWHKKGSNRSRWMMSFCTRLNWISRNLDKGSYFKQNGRKQSIMNISIEEIFLMTLEWNSK